jgi:hypothetical protein
VAFLRRSSQAAGYSSDEQVPTSSASASPGRDKYFTKTKKKANTFTNNLTEEIEKQSSDFRTGQSLRYSRLFLFQKITRGHFLCIGYTKDREPHKKD